MSMSNTTENATLKMHLQGADPSYRAGATQYLALFTADPGETASLASEATYTGYARVAVARTGGGWTVSGNQVSNTATVQFGECTAGSATVTHFSVGLLASGAGDILYSGALSASRAVSAGITPLFNPATLVGTVD